ncbi:hypothetical protein J6590_057374, partial [Homalodisca vitripennis]
RQQLQIVKNMQTMISKLTAPALTLHKYVRTVEKAENPRDGGLVAVTMAAVAVADCEEYADTDIKAHSPSPNSAQVCANCRES